MIPFSLAEVVCIIIATCNENAKELRKCDTLLNEAKKKRHYPTQAIMSLLPLTYNFNAHASEKRPKIAQMNVASIFFIEA